MDSKTGSSAASLLTPPRLKQIVVPMTPAKKPPKCFFGESFDLTPSKPRRSVPMTVQRNSMKTIDIADLLPSLTGNMNSQKVSKDIDALDSPFTFDNDSISNSDTGSLNSLSDLSSVPSSSPEFEKFTYLDPWNNSAPPNLADPTFELNRIIFNSLSSGIEEPGLRKRSFSSHCYKHEPCHRIKKVGRSILKLHSGSLNLLVTSSRGSLEDATIFATEINASLSSPLGGKIPSIKNIYEKVTIPVNTSIKERHKKLKKSLMGDDYESEPESETSEELKPPDAAYIKGFEFELNEGNGLILNRGDENRKSVQWARSLVL